METTNSISLKGAVKKYDSVEAAITGPLEASNGKMYFKGSFQRNTTDDGGYTGQSKDYTKLFWEDNHSLIFKMCAKLVESGKPLKILAARLSMPTNKSFYITDADGNRRKNQDDEFITGDSITMFLLEDENPNTEFKRRCKQISRAGNWVEAAITDDDDDTDNEREKEKEANKPLLKGKK